MVYEYPISHTDERKSTMHHGNEFNRVIFKSRGEILATRRRDFSANSSLDSLPFNFDEEKNH